MRPLSEHARGGGGACHGPTAIAIRPRDVVHDALSDADRPSVEVLLTRLKVESMDFSVRPSRSRTRCQVERPTFGGVTSPD
jgi:hypothetical protein